MSRPETPVDESNPVGKFATDLRALRASAGLTYREMAGLQGVSSATLSKAAAGKRLPTHEVLLAYVRACKGDERQWTDRWRALWDSIPENSTSPRQSFSRAKGQRSHGVGAIERPSVDDEARASARTFSAQSDRALLEEHDRYALFSDVSRPAVASERDTPPVEGSIDQRALDLQIARATQLGDRDLEYQSALNALASYGLRIMTAWIRSGKIFDKCAERGRRISVPRWFDPNDVDDLVSDVVAEGLFLFKDQIGKRNWDPSLGASSSTYFIGSCLFAFPNALRRHSRIRESWKNRESIAIGDNLDLLDFHVSQSPENEAITRSDLHLQLAKMPRHHQRVLWGSVLELTHADLADRLGLSRDAVVSQLRRARAELRKRLLQGVSDSASPGKVLMSKYPYAAESRAHVARKSRTCAAAPR